MSHSITIYRERFVLSLFLCPPPPWEPSQLTQRPSQLAPRSYQLEESESQREGSEDQSEGSVGQQEGSEGQSVAFEVSKGYRKGFEGQPIVPVGYKVL